MPTAGKATFARELRGGRVHKVDVASFTGATMAPVDVISAFETALRPALGRLQASDLAVVSNRREVTPSRQTLTHVSYRQEVAGVPIVGTYMNLTMKTGAQGARLLASSHRLFETPVVDVAPVMSSERAGAMGRLALRSRADARVIKNDLEIREIGGRLELVYAVKIEGDYHRALVIASGPRAGRIVSIDERIHGDGIVSGSHVLGGAPGAPGADGGTVVPGIMPFVNVSGGGVTAQADGAGAYSIGVADGTPITAALSGRAANITDTTATLSAAGVAGTGVGLSFASPDENTLSQLTAYYYVDATRTFLEQNGVDGTVLGAPLQTNTNLNDVCNAFFDPGARSINFFRSGGGCNNSAIDSVIAHEYGHFVDDAFGDITNGGLSEGWGDVLGCLLLKAPELGKGIFPGGELIRTCDNTYVYPPGGFDGVHNLGQAWAGFVWHSRANLIASLGEDAGDALIRALVLPSFATNAADIPAAVREVFLRDDDDGDLSNGSPNFAALEAAANIHGLMFAVFPDETPPGQVTDLTAVAVGATSVTLSLTAPGDDGFEGTAANWDVRFSSAPIDDGNFLSAAPVASPTPVEGGTPATIVVSLPPGTTGYLAMRAVDEVGHIGLVSNNVSVTTDAGVVIYEDGAEGGLGAWTATGLWHVTTRRASEGMSSFWYGQESTGNYNTGAANSGQLTSPVIDLTDAHAPVLVVDELIEVEAAAVYDLANIEVFNVADPADGISLAKVTGSTGGVFAPRVVELAQFEGKSIQVRFAFDTVDSVLNDTEGWYLDRVRVIGEDVSTCEHPKCVTGGPLDPTCDPCVAAICAIDAFCCNTAWDALCVDQVASVCGETCSSCGNGTCDAGEDCASCPTDCGTCAPDCAHDLCDVGDKLDPTCDTCAGSVCAADPYCCEVTWDRICVDAAEQACGLDCSVTCTHDLCEVGAPLEPTCDSCATQVCAEDPYCCANAWDRACVNKAVELCNLDCVDCAHDMCAAGEKLDPTCDPVVEQVCATDPFCCDNEWDSRCVQMAASIGGLACGCAHEICETGGKLDPSCDACVTQVCAIDPYCCENAWDDRCVEEANTQCGTTCEVTASPVRRAR